MELHLKWINHEPDGVKANLSGADLHKSNLYGVNFCLEDDYVYTVGETVISDSFDKDRCNEDTGIDFFIAREMAVR